jgi:hypothetical protein
MTREVWVYPANGSDPVRKEDYRPTPQVGQFTVMPDLPDFQSPIDGKRYSGRAGMREHNIKHNVVPTADLAGLPTTKPAYNPSSRERAERKQGIINLVNQHWK